MKNIVLMMSDQLRNDAMGFSGNTLIQTPHLDQLAATGARFSQAFTPTPICVAARMSLFKGQRASVTHYPNNLLLPGPEPNLPTLMDVLHSAGYWTQAVGKTHFRGCPYGFQRILCQEDSPNCILDDDYLLYLRQQGIRSRLPFGHKDLLYYQPQSSTVPLEYSAEHWVAGQSVQFLRDHVRYRGERPFFLFTSWHAPHPPFTAYEPYASMYDPEEIPPPVYADRPVDSFDTGAWRHRCRIDGAHRDSQRMQRIKSLYYGKVTHMDDCAGMVLDELERLGLADDTIVIFLSDHGEMLGDHGLGNKALPYDASVHIPLLVRWPGLTEANSVRHDLVGLEDLMPTLLGQLGLEYPPECGTLPGIDWFDDQAKPRSEYYMDFGTEAKRWVSVRNKRYRYTYWLAGAARELYDLEKDPHERHNLVKEMPEVAEELHQKVVQWENTCGFPDSLTNGEFRSFPASEKLAEEDCRTVLINRGRWAENLPTDEQSSVESYPTSFTRAIEGEDSLKPEVLSMDLFKAKGGDLRGTPWEKEWLEVEVHQKKK